MLNQIISKSVSFECGIENGITVFKSEGDLPEVLLDLGFIRQKYLNRQTGRKDFGNMYYQFDEVEDSGIFVHHNPFDNTWCYQMAENDDFDNFA